MPNTKATDKFYLDSEALAFDDVSLVPQHSDLVPADADVSTRFSQNVKLGIPLSSAAMDTVTEAPLAIALAKVGGIGVIHRNLTPEAQAEHVARVKAEKFLVAAAVGPGDEKRAELLHRAGVDALVIDTAHSHSQRVLDAVKKYKKEFAVDVVAGNISTREGAAALAQAGADAVKVGQGPGAICTTRIVAGVGVPQLTAVLLAVEACEPLGVPVIADGGIRYSGDVAKAIGAGASSVMMGSLFAACTESPGEVITVNGRQFKSYRGMGSLGAMMAGSKARYGQVHVTEKQKLVPEGVEAAVPLKGSVADAAYQLIGGLKSGMGYVGAKNIVEMQKKARFVRVTRAGVAESHPHDVTIVSEAPNYSRA